MSNSDNMSSHSGNISSCVICRNKGYTDGFKGYRLVLLEARRRELHELINEFSIRDDNDDIRAFKNCLLEMMAEDLFYMYEDLMRKFQLIHASDAEIKNITHVLKLHQSIISKIYDEYA